MEWQPVKMKICHASSFFIMQLRFLSFIMPHPLSLVWRQTKLFKKNYIFIITSDIIGDEIKGNGGEGRNDIFLCFI